LCVTKKRGGERNEVAGNQAAHAGNRADPVTQLTQNTPEEEAAQEHKSTGTEKSNNHTKHSPEHGPQRPPGQTPNRKLHQRYETANSGGAATGSAGTFQAPAAREHTAHQRRGRKANRPPQCATLGCGVQPHPGNSGRMGSRSIVPKINNLGTTPYSLRASASLHMEEYTCNSKGGNHQKPQTHPTEQLV
jgi:hypothetical protein